jgi:flagellum-specific peptidoglycan hydrolase FlgJ
MGLESGLESPYATAESVGLESGWESGHESAYETGSFESPAYAESPYLSSSSGSTGFEDAAYEDTYANMGFEDASVAESAAGAESGLEHLWELSAGESVGSSESAPLSESAATECASCGRALESVAQEDEQPHGGVPPHVVEFVRRYHSAAQTSEAATGVPALVTLGQAALESGWGKRAPGFNFFGIKARAADPPQTRQLLTTREVLPRSNVQFPQVISVTPGPGHRYTYVVKDWFRRYPSVEQGLAAHGKFLRANHRYAGAFTHLADPYAFARAVAGAGYATDPRYADVLTSVMRLIERASRVLGKAPAAKPPTPPAPSPAGQASPSPAPSGVPVPAESVPIPQLAAPPPCVGRADASADRPLRTPGAGSGRFEDIPQIAAFATALAGIYGQRVGRDAAARHQKAREREEWLAGDYTATMKAGLTRYGGAWRQRVSKQVAAKHARLRTARRGALTRDDLRELEAERCRQEAWWRAQLSGLRKGWMVGRREQVDFSTLMPSLPYLPAFNPPAVPPGGAPALEPIAPYGSGTPVAAPTRRFLAELRRLAGSSFSAGNYSGHGGGSFLNRGYSVDLFLNAQLDDRGFYPRAAAVAFLGQVSTAAKATGLRWRILYNDFAVAAEVNRRTGMRNVFFTGDSSKALNWHGPLVLHFHLDLAP